MRLSEHVRSVIVETAHAVFDEDVAVKLFGSRLNDDAKGGDIDILIESQKALPMIRKKSLRLVARLQMQLGDQPIDVLVVDPATERGPVHREAMRTGVAL